MKCSIYYNNIFYVYSTIKSRINMYTHINVGTYYTYTHFEKVIKYYIFKKEIL